VIDFKRFHVTFRKAENHSYVIFRLFTSSYDLPYGDPAKEPMPSVYFYWTREEFEAVVDGKQGMSVDGYHLCKHDGERWTFLDWEVPLKPFGKATVDYRVVEMPYRVQKILLRLARWHFRHLDRAAKGSEHEIEIDMRTRTRLITRYGQAKGIVKMVEADGVNAVARGITDEGLAEKLDRLWAIARNTTFNKWETATVNLYRDSAGYYFQILTPTGRRSMNGGVINHGSDEKPDWSIHT
jgi:hypothetical protein